MVAWYILAIVVDYIRQTAWNFIYNKSKKLICKERIG